MPAARDRRRDQRGHVEPRRVQPQLARFGERELLEIVDELSKVQHLVAHVAIRGGGRGRQTVHPRFEPAAERSQRRAQFVRDVVQQSAPQCVLALELRGHRVESPPEIRDFTRSAHGDAPFELARAQVARRRAQLRDGADDPAADHPGRGDRQHRRQHRDEQRAAIERAEKRRSARIVEPPVAEFLRAKRDEIRVRPAAVGEPNRQAAIVQLQGNPANFASALERRVHFQHAIRGAHGKACDRNQRRPRARDQLAGGIGDHEQDAIVRQVRRDAADRVRRAALAVERLHHAIGLDGEPLRGAALQVLEFQELAPRALTRRERHRHDRHHRDGAGREHETGLQAREHQPSSSVVASL